MAKRTRLILPVADHTDDAIADAHEHARQREADEAMAQAETAALEARAAQADNRAARKREREVGQFRAVCEAMAKRERIMDAIREHVSGRGVRVQDVIEWVTGLGEDREDVITVMENMNEIIEENGYIWEVRR